LYNSADSFEAPFSFFKPTEAIANSFAVILGVLCDVNHFPDHIAADPAGVDSTKCVGVCQVNPQFIGCFHLKTIQGITDAFAVGTAVAALVIAAHFH